MKIVTFYESRLGRNDGAPLYYTLALRALGHEVVHLSSANHPTEKFDLYLWVDWGEDGLQLPYEPISLKGYSPSLYIASDTHLGLEYRLKKAKEFTHVFVNQKEAVKVFVDYLGHNNVWWVPHAANLQAYPAMPNCIKKYDVGFVGFVGSRNRAEFLEKVFAKYPNFVFASNVFFEKAAEIYKQCKVVLNHAVNNDLNMRVFEVLATKSCLLTPDVPGLHDLLLDQHLTSYNNEDYEDAIKKIELLLNNKKIREVKANTGYNIVSSLHTYDERAKELIKIIEKGV